MTFHTPQSHPIPPTETQHMPLGAPDEHSLTTTKYDGISNNT